MDILKRTIYSLSSGVTEFYFKHCCSKGAIGRKKSSIKRGFIRAARRKLKMEKLWPQQ